MVATIGEAYSIGWKIRVHCAWGKRLGMKSIRECVAGATVDLETLVWTRGKDFPIARLEAGCGASTAGHGGWSCTSRRRMTLTQRPRGGSCDEPEK
jgi:hypothetical protein